MAAAGSPVVGADPSSTTNSCPEEEVPVVVRLGDEVDDVDGVEEIVVDGEELVELIEVVEATEDDVDVLVVVDFGSEA